MNVLLLNVHSPQNAGDLAILEESLAILRRGVPNASITVAINDRSLDRVPPDAVYVPSFMNWVMRVDNRGEWHWRKPLTLVCGVWLLMAAFLYRIGSWRVLPRDGQRRALMQAYYDADIVAVIGGGHLYARHSVNIAFAWLWLGIALAIIMRKRLIMLPQSYGPLPGALQRSMLRWLLDRCDLLTTREYQSMQLLGEIGLRRRVLVLPDLAFAAAQSSWQAATSAYPALDQIAAAGKPLIGMTLMDWQGQNPNFTHQAAYEQALNDLIRYVHARYGATVVLFAQCTGPTAAQDDRRIARRIAAQLTDQISVQVVDAVLSPEALRAAYARMDLFVATRMHSAIFALTEQVPTLAIGYLHKSIGIMEQLGLQRYVLDIGAIDAISLQACFDQLWADQALVRDRLRQRIPQMQHTVAHLADLIEDVSR